MIKGFRKSPHIFFLLFITTCWIIGCNRPQEELNESFGITAEDQEVVVPESRYGFPVDSFKISTGKIGKNQFLSDLLLEYNVPYPIIDRMAKESVDLFDVRKIRAGHAFAVFELPGDSVPSYFVYEIDPVNYVVYDLTGKGNSRLDKKEVSKNIRKASGTITSSLYETMAAQDLSPSLALELSKVFAWTIDFYRLQKGDNFKIIFEEMEVDGNLVGVGNILAAEFHHEDTTFFNFLFEQDEKLEYFDHLGRSAKKIFLQSPLKFSRISSRFTMRRFHPVQKRMKAHLGTDYAAPKGTPILATGDGTVIESKFSTYNGNYVKIKHTNVYTTQYLHMSKRAVKKGDRVRQGEVIGYVGSTGLATGPHVCYRFWKNGKQVDHLKEKFPSGDPVKPAYKAQFELLKDSLLVELNSIPPSGQEN